VYITERQHRHAGKECAVKSNRQEMISFLCNFFAYDSIYSIEKACQNSAENSCYASGKSIAFQYSADQHTANEGERYTDQFVSSYWFMKEDSRQAYLVSF
jgi:hypothetical protein